MAMAGGTIGALIAGRNDPGFVHNGPLAGLVAICAGSRDSAIAVFIKIASAPSSMAIAASDGTPTPASTINVASGSCSRIIRKFEGF